MMTDACACGLTEKHSKVRLHLPLELHCELFSALPFEHAARLLLLSKAIAKNCNSLVKKTSKRVEGNFRKRIEEVHHSRIQAAQQDDQKLNKEIRISCDKLSPLIGVNLVRHLAKCGTAGEVMYELLKSAAYMHHIIEQ
ncbi:hypothetical protein niasHS_001145 [Heterodera schachtii]|uniref:F-box domain-containing protein n=1 Tax=Heterodera schachtii TaxID=97005 RepID=A0ABD2KCV1_HETSC